MQMNFQELIDSSSGKTILKKYEFYQLLKVGQTTNTKSVPAKKMRSECLAALISMVVLKKHQNSKAAEKLNGISFPPHAGKAVKQPVNNLCFPVKYYR